VLEITLAQSAAVARQAAHWSMEALAAIHNLVA
jgi:hypothetical protein